MRITACFAGILGVVALGWMGVAQDEAREAIEAEGIAEVREAYPATALPEDENLEGYVGRSLAIDARAAREGVRHLLPQSCPPFYLRDEFGRIIDPTTNAQALPPASMKQTCGALGCHDVAKVVEGYHFQMGRDELYEEPKLGETMPIDKSPGFFGKFQLLYQRELCPKRIESPDQVDMTPFDWVNACGVCHPGGGPAEYDRGGHRYSEIMANEPFLRDMLDGDYRGARWNETGVVEPDCLICHLDTYDFSLRAQQLKKLNYKWAGMEAAGLGTVEGTVSEGKIPKVTYRKALFGADGKVHLAIRRPSDRACLTCHDISGIQKRGSGWKTHYMQDVHTEQGFMCTDCHQGDIRHNFTKGYSSSLSARDDLDGSMQSCRHCHYETQEFGAPAHVHRGLTQLHLDRLGCQTCHITKRPFLTARVVDSLTGKVIELPNNPNPARNWLFGAQWGTIPTIERDAVMQPIALEGLAAAADLSIEADSPIRSAFAPSVLPEAPFTVREFMEPGPGLVDTTPKRLLMLLALQEVLHVDESASVTCVFRGKAYRMAGGIIERRGVQLQPNRVGDVVEWPYTYSWHEVQGQEVLYPEGYQLGVYWAFQDGDLIRPVYVKEMKAAWAMFGRPELRVLAYPGRPANGQEPLELPNAAQVTPEDYAKAVTAKYKQYGGSEVRPGAIDDDTLDVWPEANTELEIALMGWALTATMTRLHAPELYYIRGASVFRFTVPPGTPNPFAVNVPEIKPMSNGMPFLALARYEQVDKVKDEWERKEIRLAPLGQVERIDPASNPQLAALAQPLRWTASHGVEPASMALGAKGCTDCHSMRSPLFFASVTVDPFGADAVPVREPAYKQMGYTLCGLSLGAWREGIVKPYAPWAVLAVLVLFALHYTVFGSKNGEPYVPDVRRFNLIERTAHLVLMVSVVYLCVTGFCFLLGVHDPLGVWSRYLHSAFGYVAGGAFVLVTLCWAWNMLPARGDATWMLHFGGYLGGKGHYPAGKFNAGQKILFWIALGLMATLVVTGVIMALNLHNRFPQQQLVYTLHDAAAALMILLLLGHIYLAVFANPHAVRSLFGGLVSSAWAKKHHPDWKLPR